MTPCHQKQLQWLQLLSRWYPYYTGARRHQEDEDQEQGGSGPRRRREDESDPATEDPMSIASTSSVKNEPEEFKVEDAKLDADQKKPPVHEAQENEPHDAPEYEPDESNDERGSEPPLL